MSDRADLSEPKRSVPGSRCSRFGYCTVRRFPGTSLRKVDEKTPVDDLGWNPNSVPTYYIWYLRCIPVYAPFGQFLLNCSSGNLRNFIKSVSHFFVFFSRQRSKLVGGHSRGLEARKRPREERPHYPARALSAADLRILRVRFSYSDTGREVLRKDSALSIARSRAGAARLRAWAPRHGRL